jgi:SAM-dependent methyltransferase
MTSANIQRYEFGKNWIRFAKRSANAERINIARQHLLTFCNRRDLKGMDFLDVGCGSGIHSLAACQAGARRIHSFDYDADSVQATTIMRQSADGPINWTIERGDVLDERYIGALGKWNFVYSWGVLHHTGDVWRALDNASKTVADAGTLYIALYSEDVQRDPQFWLDVKQRYNRASPAERRRMEWWYVWHFVMGRNLMSFPNLVWRITHHRLTRGMSFFTDIRDWLGGWPMEFTRDANVIEFLGDRGFSLANIKTGEACTEFLFCKNN